MWKLLAILFIGAASATTQIHLTCRFGEVGHFRDYGCLLSGIDSSDRQANYIFGGEHSPGKTNADVKYVGISNSNTPFMLQGLFTHFTNLDDLEITNSNLQEINIGPAANLKWISLSGNNFQRVTAQAFRFQSQVLTLSLRNNSIQYIDSVSFGSNTLLRNVYLENNRIETIVPGLFRPLRNLRSISFEGNSLSEITEEMFETNTLVTQIHLQRNRINAVHPRFASNLSQLNHVDFSGNVCINGAFELPLEEAAMNNALQTCFARF